MSNRTSLRMRVLPRFPARISGTNGLEVEQENLDLIVKPDFESLAEIVSVGSPDDTFFWVMLPNGLYARMSFQKITDGIGAIIIGPTTAAMEATSPVADQMIYFTGPDVAAVTSLTGAGRALLDDADAAAQRTTLGLNETWLLALIEAAIPSIPTSLPGSAGKLWSNGGLLSIS